MDIYEARRLVVLRVIRQKFGESQAAFAVATGVSPSYVTRMLKEPSHPSHKKIGEDMALKLEGVEAAGLRTGELLNPTLDRKAAAGETMLELSETEFDMLQSFQDMSDKDRAEMLDDAMRRAARFRSLTDEVLRRHVKTDIAPHAFANAPVLPGLAKELPKIVARKAQVLELPGTGHKGSRRVSGPYAAPKPKTTKRGG